MASAEYVGRKSNRGGAATKAELASAIIYYSERAQLRVMPRPAIPLRAVERVEYRYDYTVSGELVVTCVRSTGGML